MNGLLDKSSEKVDRYRVNINIYKVNKYKTKTNLLN